MEKPTQQHTAGLRMAKQIATSEGMCPRDLPAMLDSLIVEAIVSPYGRPALEEIFDLASELRKAGASMSEKQYKNDFDRGMGFALSIVLKRIKTLQ
ncbi:hypothetical protein D9M68_601740 [compost metagenome]